MAVIIECMLTLNVIPVKDVRSLAGKAMNVATVIYVWRPFLRSLWTAIASLNKLSDNSGLPVGCVWRKQIVSALMWLRAFLKEEQGEISRHFDWDNFFGMAPALEITTDASPWGIGGWISMNNVPIAYYSDSITAFDEEILGHTAGTCEGQQTFESLALLVAHRLWYKVIAARRARHVVRSDNLGALHTFASLKGRGAGMNLISREFALDAGKCELTPDVIAHLPGVANGVADTLSRRFDPAKAASWTLPSFLSLAKECSPPLRQVAWWRARVPPGGAMNG